MNSSRKQKTRRRWLPFRFGLRTLLLFTALVAGWLSLESRRAQNQEALIARACRDTDPKVREVALRELPNLARREGTSAYLVGVADPDANVRWQAAHALEQYPDPKAVEPLITALSDENSLVRCAAAKTLGKIAEPCSLQALEAATQDKDSFVREAASAALAKFNQAAATHSKSPAQ